ncbi:alanine--tRNA ligase-related protein [Paenibacillus spongiae]|uniref:alanine--tRNA ligase-related protein n=1 Tax=Paenibacillus spongiae TaxID=2909671 RepID=UPI0035A231CB
MKLYTSEEIRAKYIQFFQEKGHAVISSASVIPDNDPTVLFTTAGMHPLVPYLLGEKHPSGTRLTNVQKCIRTVDIDEVGDDRGVGSSSLRRTGSIYPSIKLRLLYSKEMMMLPVIRSRTRYGVH